MTSENFCEKCDGYTTEEELNQYDGLCYWCYRDEQKEFYRKKKKRLKRA